MTAGKGSQSSTGGFVTDIVPIVVIGVGATGRDTLSAQALEWIDRAEILYGGHRLLALFPEVLAERVALTNNLEDVVGQMKARLHRRQVVLASGDPNWFGVAHILYRHLDKQWIRVEPNITSMQLAFARIRETWHDAYWGSVHGRPLDPVTDWVARYPKVAVLTDPKNHPGAIARRLLEEGWRDVQMYVAENLGMPTERVISLSLDEAIDQSFSPLNVVVLIRKPDATTAVGLVSKGDDTAFGIDDHEFFQRRPARGLLTKKEVRVVTLAQLGLKPGHIFWDIGAGSGSVSIEAYALVRPHGQVFAVEQHPEDAANLRRNAEKFGRPVHLLEAKAPDGLQVWPDPDAVFIGGSGGQLAILLTYAARRLKPGGRLVLNVVSLEHIAEALGWLQARGWVSEVTMVSAARGSQIADWTRLQALNPVFVIAAWRKPS